MKADERYSLFALDVEEFLPDLEEWDVSREQKIEWLQALSHVMQEFVDIGWGKDTVSTMLKQRVEEQVVSQQDD